MQNNENTAQILSMIHYDLFKNIEEYAHKHTKSSMEYYESRNTQTRPYDYYFQNCLRGKLAEYNMYFHLKQQSFCVTEPDIKIYKTKKSYDSDLIILGKENELYSEDDKIHLHIKSISLESFKNYGTAFLLQKNDPIVADQKNEIYKKHFFVALHESENNFLEYNNIKRIAVHDAKYLELPHLPSKVKVIID